MSNVVSAAGGDETISNGAQHASTLDADTSSGGTDSSDETDSDDTMYFSDCDVQFLPEPPEQNEYANAAYEVMYDVMATEMVKNWRTVRSVFAEQFDPAKLCKEQYTGPKPWQFKRFTQRLETKQREANGAQDAQENKRPGSPSLPNAKRSPRIKEIQLQISENREAASFTSRAESDDQSITLSLPMHCSARSSDLWYTSVWPAECCEACRLQGHLTCQCPVTISMPHDMLDGENPTSSHMDILPVVRTLKLAPQPSEVRIILPHGSHQRGRVAQMEYGRAMKYPTYETRYIKPLPAGNFWLPLSNNMHARDLITYRVVPYISEDIDIAKWEQEYSEMHEQRRDRAAYRRVRDCLFNNSPLLTKVVKKMKKRLAPTKQATAPDEKTFEQNIFKALSNSVPNAPSPDELYEQKYLFPNDVTYRNRICLPSLDADPSYECSYEKRIHTFLTLYCPRCRMFDCHEHEHKQCAPAPGIVLIPFMPPPTDSNKWCTPSTDCFANVYEKVKSVRDFDKNGIVVPEFSAVAKAYLNDLLHGPKTIPGYYANTTSSGANSASAMLLASGSSNNLQRSVVKTEHARSNASGLCESQLCCEVTEMVNGLLMDPKLRIKCIDVYIYYLNVLAERGHEAVSGSQITPVRLRQPHASPSTTANASSTAASSSSRGGKRRGSTTSNLTGRKRSSFKQAPAYKAMQSSRQLSRLPHEPCHHPEFASCSEAAARASACICAKRKIFCEKFCSCDDRCCGNRVRFCTCTSGCNSLRCPCYVAERECDPHRCRCEQIGMCKNMAMQLGLKKKIVVAQSSTHGLGVFVMEDAKEGEFVYEYMGEKVSDYEAERRGRFYDKMGLSFLFGLNAEESIDATRCGNKIRFANHSEHHANLRARIMSVFGDHRIGLYALRDLKRGEELFFNYFYKGNHLKFVPNEPTALPPLRSATVQNKGASRLLLRREDDEAADDEEGAEGADVDDVAREEEEAACGSSSMLLAKNTKVNRRNDEGKSSFPANRRRCKRSASKQPLISKANDGKADEDGAKQHQQTRVKRRRAVRKLTKPTKSDSVTLKEIDTEMQNGAAGAAGGSASLSYEVANTSNGSSARRAGILDALLGEIIDEQDDEEDDDAVDLSQINSGESAQL